jgi:hypothetical protein
MPRLTANLVEGACRAMHLGRAGYTAGLATTPACAAQLQRSAAPAEQRRVYLLVQVRGHRSGSSGPGFPGKAGYHCTRIYLCFRARARMRMRWI